MNVKISSRRAYLFLIDLAMVASSYGVIYFLSSFDNKSLFPNGPIAVVKMLALYVCIFAVRTLAGVYTAIWRYARSRSYLKLILADALGGFLFFLLSRFVVRSLYFGFAYTIIMVMMNILLTLCSRLVYQMLYTSINTTREKKNLDFRGDHAEDNSDNKNKINVAIVGAGNVGATLASEFLRNPKSHYIPYCFIDTDKAKIGAYIEGIKIYSADDDIVGRIKTMPIQEIIIAIPDASGEYKTELYNKYKETGCQVKIYDYPSNADSSTFNSSTGKRVMRKFEIEDLLFRDAIKIKNSKTDEFYAGKTVIVTGGGGSIGSELCRQIARLSLKKLVILDIYENNAYEIQQELVRRYGAELELETIIASVRDVKRIDEIFDRVRPQIVFHAAAHKHVPLMENNGSEAIKNNVLGTYNVANAAEKYGVEKFLLISTDKAVNPTNIMGASKRLCEMVIQCRNNSNTEFTAVRFGNVLGSNGSVIPLFKKQIEAGGPITITDRRIIRYFMTVPEAVSLVMETCAMAHNGELFVLDMGKPVKIIELAENMIKLSGLVPYEDIDIVEIGLRPGEKLYEELLMKTEGLDKTENNMIFIERDKALTREDIEDKLDVLNKALADASDVHTSSEKQHECILDAIRKTVPTYHSPEEMNQRAGESEEMLRAVGGEREAAYV